MLQIIDNNQNNRQQRNSKITVSLNHAYLWSIWIHDLSFRNSQKGEQNNLEAITEQCINQWVTFRMFDVTTQKPLNIKKY